MIPISCVLYLIIFYALYLVVMLMLSVEELPQGSCLGPILFTLYASKLFEIVKTHLPEVLFYADTQVYISFSPKP